MRRCPYNMQVVKEGRTVGQEDDNSHLWTIGKDVLMLCKLSEKEGDTVQVAGEGRTAEEE